MSKSDINYSKESVILCYNMVITLERKVSDTLLVGSNPQINSKK